MEPGLWATLAPEILGKPLCGLRVNTGDSGSFFFSTPPRKREWEGRGGPFGQAPVQPALGTLPKVRETMLQCRLAQLEVA